MSLTSIEFILFLLGAVVVLQVTPRSMRTVLLTIVNFIFFYIGSGISGTLVLISVLAVVYIGARVISISNKKENLSANKRICLLWCALTTLVALCPLLVFKYAGFVLEAASTFISMPQNVLEGFSGLIAPLGISFFTMQGIGYLIDVYRGNRDAIVNIFDYLAFAAFFPTIVSGPIQRSYSLPAQLSRIREERFTTSYDQVKHGAITILWGMFLKMVIADRVALLVNTVYDAWWLYGSIELIWATVGYALQIFCDFAGYSCIAIGAARMMGFDAGENFNTPYLAQSVQDFWRRWHISLSTWLCDYIYIPLGGSRKGAVRRYINVFIVFAICGIWHGAGWHFLIWGIMQGLFQCIGIATYKLRYRYYDRLGFKTSSFGWRFGRILCTFLLICVSWVFFRAPYVSYATGILSRIIFEFNPWVLFDGSLETLGLSDLDETVLLLSVVFLVLVSLVKRFRGVNLAQFLDEQPIPFSWSVLLFLIAFVFLFGMYGPSVDASSFIYAQF